MLMGIGYGSSDLYLSIYYYNYIILYNTVYKYNTLYKDNALYEYHTVHVYNKELNIYIFIIFFVMTNLSIGNTLLHQGRLSQFGGAVFRSWCRTEIATAKPKRDLLRLLCDMNVMEVSGSFLHCQHMFKV